MSAIVNTVASSPFENIVTSSTDQNTGLVTNARLNGVAKLFEKKGVVANGTSDDASALQEAILAARYEWGGAIPIPTEISKIKINSGITLNADTDRLTCDRPILLDCSGITSGNAINIDCGVTDSNVAPLYNILNFINGIRMVGGGVPGVAAMRFYGATGKPYFYQVKNVSADNFALTVDLYGNTFGVAFEDVSFRSSTGGTLIQCLSGGGANYGERYNFTRAMLYNSGRCLYNTYAAATFRFINSSFDYSDVMADVQAGRVSLDSCHIETSYDADYLFKVGTNESSALTLDKCEFVLNGVNRTKELFSIDDNVKFGGIFVNNTMISHGAGYSAASYVAGTGRAISRNLMTFTANTKPVFSRFMSKLTPGFEQTGNLAAEWTLTGTVLPVLNTGSPYEGVNSLYFGPSTAASTATITVPIEAGQHPRIAYRYKKTGSATGQGLLKTRLQWMMANGTTQIGSDVVLDDIDGNNDWTLRRSSVNVLPPIGARYFKLVFYKAADTGGTAAQYIDDVIINTI